MKMYYFSLFLCEAVLKEKKNCLRLSEEYNLPVTVLETHYFNNNFRKYFYEL